MTIEQITLLVGVAALATGAMVVALVAAWYAGRRGADTTGMAPPRDPRPDQGGPLASQRNAADEAALETPRPGIYDRVVRVVAFLFLASVAVVVAVTYAYPETEVAIYLLIAVGTLFIVLVQDLLPTGALGRARYWLEATFAVVFLAVLMGLSGGLHSPFFVGFFLLVGGAALSVEGLAPVALALMAGFAYAAVGVLVPGPDGSGTDDLAWIAFNLVALGLLAFIATVAGREQRRAREAAVRLSRYDPLTGLYNRSYLFAVMDREVRRSARMGRGFSVLMLDLDDLKPVNDTFGHQYGDRLLRSVTDVLQRTVRTTDTAARYGGDEFVVLLPETDPDGAFVVAEKLRRDIAGLAIRVDERSVRTSVSIGMVAFPEDGGTIEQLISSVDAAMYEAKRRGKNQIVGYTTRTERVATPIASERQLHARTRGPRGDEPRPSEFRGPPPPDTADLTAVPTASAPTARPPAQPPAQPPAPAPTYPTARPPAPAPAPAYPPAPAPVYPPAPAPAYPTAPLAPPPAATPAPTYPPAPPAPPPPPVPSPAPPAPAQPALWETRSEPTFRSSLPQAFTEPPIDRGYVAFPIEPDLFIEHGWELGHPPPDEEPDDRG